MTKADLIDAVAHRLKLPHPRAELLVDLVFLSMSDALMRGEGIEIRGFGSFTVGEYRGYDGRNPRTGAVVKVRAKKLPFFMTGKELREKVGRGRGVGVRPCPTAPVRAPT